MLITDYISAKYGNKNVNISGSKVTKTKDGITTKIARKDSDYFVVDWTSISRKSIDNNKDNSLLCSNTGARGQGGNR